MKDTELTKWDIIRIVTAFACFVFMTYTIPQFTMGNDLNIKITGLGASVTLLVSGLCLLSSVWSDIQQRKNQKNNWCGYCCPVSRSK